MNVRKLKEGLQGASNVLVLAPLTPDGNRTHMELVASTPPEDMSLAAVTYTQPPDQWIEDWQTSVRTPPQETQFIHASGMAQPDAYEEQTPDSVATAVVDPTDPMEIIVPLSSHLEEWTASETQPIVSVQTLTVLLEYVDFDTAFRYLHILTHRVQAAGAVGYFQMDPDIHDPETINTLKTLFDVIVEISEEGAEWTMTPAYTSSERTTESDESDESDVSDDMEYPSDGPLSSIRTILSGLFDRSTTGETEAGTESVSDTEMTVEPETDGKPESDERAPVGNLADEEMLTDEERIRSLLIQYGGRMKQADITAETSWSKSTVSRKLTKMEENEEITRVQVGRGNLVFLNGSEPEAYKSPFEA
ncbi:helix-turn-helix transcriptional regulator [Haladaptatus halobius]|uniref:helix-turn-helix transcriptional regulator n=1 Tax=Haladaptatus halobius TaxID=2884875 RepID=UPI001D0BC5BE|nr:MarR family transcriptional regulator [Haladaptatus halobius]